MTGKCCMCGVPTEEQWGTATDRPVYICQQCGDAEQDAAAEQQAAWLASGRCTCCGAAELSPRAGHRAYEQLCESCMWPPTAAD